MTVKVVNKEDNTSPEKSGGQDTDDIVISMDVDSSDEIVDFPLAELDRLDEMLHRPRWVVPVLPKGELEVLLDAAIDLSSRGTKGRDRSYFNLTLSCNTCTRNYSRFDYLNINIKIFSPIL